MSQRIIQTGTGNTQNNYLNIDTIAFKKDLEALLKKYRLPNNSYQINITGDANFFTVNHNYNIPDNVSYSLIAKMNFWGLEMYSDIILVTGNPLHDAMKKIYYIDSTGITKLKTQDSIQKYVDLAMSISPNFPFSYFAKAVYLRSINDTSWARYAVKTISILNITTKIEGHNGNHDDAMNIINKWFEK